MTKRVTAAELLAQLKRDPDFGLREQRQDREVKEKASSLQLEEQPLLEDLRLAGFAVTSVWDLVNSDGDYRDAIPVLLSHLARSYSSPIREGIARALGTPAAVMVWDAVRASYLCEQDARVKDGLAAALAAIADDSVLESTIALVHDPANGPSRLLLLGALAKSKAPRAREALSALRRDPFFGKEARVLLRKSRVR
jgi:hypothetical protein